MPRTAVTTTTLDATSVSRTAGTRAVLSLRGISMRFPGVLALSDIDLDVYAGECHALLGQNGAGKSTLVKIVSGAQHASAGTLLFEGAPAEFHSPADAQKAGIYTIYQELSLVPALSAAENVYLSDLPRRRRLVQWRDLQRQARETLLTLGFDIDVKKPVRELPVAGQQAVEIAKAIHHEAKILLLDEPTATLPRPDVEKLFEVVRGLTAAGVGIVYISHRLEEVYEICDRITVLRDGRRITTQRKDELAPDGAVRAMVGEELLGGLVSQLGRGGRNRINPRPPKASRVPALEVRSLSEENVLRDVSLKVLPGEIVAVAGLVGSGQSELAACLFGARPRTTGNIFVNGREARVRSPRSATRAGLGLLPEERKSQGLVLGMPLAANVTMASLDRVAPFGILRRRSELRMAEQIVRTIGVRATHVGQKVGTLSGGNQQKVVFAKWLVANAKVMIISEPTRGIDIAAKEEIYRAIRGFLEQGGSTLVISSELDEALMCDRIYVLTRGRIVAEFEHNTVDADRLVSLLR